jgi:hypothetical protein
VKTENGQNFADSIGYEEPPMSLEDSVRGVLEQVSYMLIRGGGGAEKRGEG